jgi:DHA2 family multidrug resistance protein-like MFS transporter
MIVGSAPPERAGVASAISETGSEFGGALGIAILGSVGTAVYRAAMVAAMPNGITPEAAAAARDTLGGAVAVAVRLPVPLGEALLHAARGAFTHAMEWTAIISAAVVLAMAIAAALLLQRVGTDAESDRDLEWEPDAATAAVDGSHTPASATVVTNRPRNKEIAFGPVDPGQRLSTTKQGPAVEFTTFIPRTQSSGEWI